MTNRPKRSDLTQERLKELVTYNPETGIFTWNHPVGKLTIANRRLIQLGGTIAGYDHGGYRVIALERNVWRAHRLAFLFMTGSIPAVIDHKNRDPMDNRWSNLRPATVSQNRANSKISSENKTGVTGVQYNIEWTKPYRALIKHNNNSIFLGQFMTLEAAAKVRIEAERRIFGEYSPNSASGVV